MSYKDYINWIEYCGKYEHTAIGKTHRYAQICKPRYSIHRLRYDPLNGRRYYAVAHDICSLLYINARRELGKD